MIVKGNCVERRAKRKYLLRFCQLRGRNNNLVVFSSTFSLQIFNLFCSTWINRGQRAVFVPSFSWVAHECRFFVHLALRFYYSTLNESAPHAVYSVAHKYCNRGIMLCNLMDDCLQQSCTKDGNLWLLRFVYCRMWLGNYEMKLYSRAPGLNSSSSLRLATVRPSNFMQI